MVAIALRRADGRWLMHRRPPDKTHAGLWEFPGGKREAGEPARRALARECREELGIAIDPGDLALIAREEGPIPAPPHRAVIALYSCARWRGELASLEGGAVGWFTPAEAFALPVPPIDRALRRRLWGDRAERSLANPPPPT